MKQTIVFLALLASALAAHTFVKRQISGGIDLTKVPEVMADKEKVAAYVKCFISSDADAATACDPIGLKLKEMIKLAIEKEGCPTECNDEEKKTIAYVIRTLKVSHADQWAIVKDHAKLPAEKSEKFEAWLASIPA